MLVFYALLALFVQVQTPLNLRIKGQLQMGVFVSNTSVFVSRENKPYEAKEGGKQE
jgi:hypothetical protein